MRRIIIINVSIIIKNNLSWDFNILDINDDEFSLYELFRIFNFYFLYLIKFFLIQIKNE